MRMGLGGWVATVVVLALAIGCHVLCRNRVISAPAAIILLLVLLASNIWLFPYISSVQLEQPKDTAP